MKIKPYVLDLFFCLLLSLSFAMLLQEALRYSSHPAFRISAQKQTHTLPAQETIHEDFISDAKRHFVHAVSLTQLNNDKIFAAWYAGDYEGGHTGVYTAVRADKKSAAWSKPQLLLNVPAVIAQEKRYVRTIGNPIVFNSGDKLWLFFVTSFGGWSASSLNYVVSQDNGLSWSPAKCLVTSAFFNISTLGKTTPFLYEDGTLGFPAYNELINKFGELLRITPTGRIIAEHRVTWGISAIQPLIIPLTRQRALAFSRFKSRLLGHIVMSRTHDAGVSWEKPYLSTLPNPDAAVSGIALSQHAILLAFNDSPRLRNNLSLAYSPDAGQTWKRLHVFETGNRNKWYSYPYLLRSKGGNYYLAYTWLMNKKIKVLTLQSKVDHV